MVLGLGFRVWWVRVCWLGFRVWWVGAGGWGGTFRVSRSRV